MAHPLTQLLGNLASEEVLELDLSADTCRSQQGWEVLPDLSALEACAQLHKLTLSGWQLESLDVIPPLPSLAVLDVSDNELELLDGLPRFPSLKELYVSNNLLKTLAGIAAAPLLQKLHADRNELRDVSALAYCSELTHLHLANNPALRTLDSLRQLPKLVFLNLLRVPLSDLTLLQRLEALAELHLSATFGLSLSPLESTRLRVLGVGCQGLTSLVLPVIQSLETLLLRNAAMMEALPDVSGFQQLQELRLEGAGICHIEAARLPASLRRLSVKGSAAARTKEDWAPQLPACVEVIG